MLDMKPCTLAMTTVNGAAIYVGRAAKVHSPLF